MKKFVIVTLAARLGRARWARVLLVGGLLGLLASTTAGAAEITVPSDGTVLYNGAPCVVVSKHPAWVEIPGVAWIWKDSGYMSAPAGTYQWFTKSFQIPCSCNIGGSIQIAADNLAEVYVNDQYIGHVEGFASISTFSLDGVLVSGTNTIRVSVTNDGTTENPAGLTFQASITYTPDTTPPVITCPAAITKCNDTGVCSATVNPGTPTVTDCDPSPRVTGVRNDGQALTAPYPVGTTTITWTATDACNNTSSCIQAITVNDCENPTITCPDDITVCTDPGVCYATNVALGTPVTGDNCGVASVTNDAPTQFPKGDTTVTWTVTDTAGLTATCTQTVTVNDCEDPWVTCPGAITVNNDTGVCGAVVTYTVDYGDNCPGATLAQTAGLPSGSTFPVGTTTNTFVVTDAAGRTASCSFDVMVVDNEPPTITCPDDITQCNDLGICGAVVTYTPPVGTDNCPGATTALIAGLGSGATFPVGTTTETYRVTDAAGNTAECSFTITVNDCEDPSITCPGQITVQCPGNVPAPDISLVSAMDNCDPSPVITWQGDTVLTDPCGGTITRTYRATDACGNWAECTQIIITINDTVSPTIVCPPDITVNSDPDACGANVTVPTPTVNDNCGIASEVNDYTYTSDASGSYPVGTTTVRWTVTDHCGNTAQCSHTVTVTPSPALSITKVPDKSSVVTGETITYTITVTNAGKTNLSNVQVTDDLTGFSDSIANLPVSASRTFTTTYTATVTDVGTRIVNTATAKGTDPCGTTVTASATARVGWINTGPTAQDQALTTCKNTPFAITLSGSDPDLNPENPSAHPLTFSILGAPEHGTVSGNLAAVAYAGPTATDPHAASVQVIYTPALDFLGTDTFTFMVVDPFGAFAIGTIVIDVVECEEEEVAGGAATLIPVVINEVAWGGTEANPEDEWIELVNNTEETIDLSGWVLRWHRKNPTTPEELHWKVVELKGTIAPYGYYLLERGSDEVVSDIKADLIYDTEKPYQLELSDLGEVMELVDPDGNVVDTANSDPRREDGWAAGYGIGGAPLFGTLERIDPLNIIDRDENWDANQDVIINGLDAVHDCLTATVRVTNERTLIQALVEQPSQVVQAGEVIKVSVMGSSLCDATGCLPHATVTLADEVAGGAGAFVAPETVEAALTMRRLEPTLTYEFALDTSQLGPGTYHLWISLGGGAFHLITIEVVTGS